MQVQTIEGKEFVLGIILFVVLLWGNLHIQFSNDSFQEWFRFCAKVIIFFLFVGFCLQKWSAKLVFSILGLIFILSMFTPLAFFTVFVIMDQLPGNGIREQIHSISLENKNLVVYQNNCGATCAFGVDIAIEKSYLFGIFKTVNFIEHYYPANDLIFERIGPNTVKIVKTDIDRTDRQLSEFVPTEGDVWDLNNY